MKSDNEMQNDIRDELLRMLAGHAEKLSARVLDGVVTLRGTLDSEREKWNVDDAIRRMPGVRDLVNEIDVFTSDAPARSADADAARPWFPPR